MHRNCFLLVLFLAIGHTGFAQSNKPNTVDLLYSIPETTKVIFFYNELTVTKHADISNQNFIACGFSKGYFGLRVTGKNEKHIVFNINSQKEFYKAVLLGEGEKIVHPNDNLAYWKFDWKAETSYKFLITALPDSASSSTSYSGYFFAPELDAWKFIASFRIPNDGKYLSQLYSSLENPGRISGVELRKTYFNNGWVRDDDNKWTELNKATLACRNGATNPNNIGGGLENKRFYLWNTHQSRTDANCGQLLSRDTTGIKPVVNLYHHLDSTIQAKKEIATIKKAVRNGVIDTTGSVQDVWYKILKEGTGAWISATDTVTAFYKGWVLNGPVFDSTEKEPAVFPLNRLIRGWQIGLPKNKVGGKIRLIIPSGLAYSIRNRAFDIPPNSILVFDIEVVSARRKD